MALGVRQARKKASQKASHSGQRQAGPCHTFHTSLTDSPSFAVQRGVLLSSRLATREKAGPPSCLGLAGFGYVDAKTGLLKIIHVRLSRPNKALPGRSSVSGRSDQISSIEWMIKHHGPRRVRTLLLLFFLLDPFGFVFLPTPSLEPPRDVCSPPSQCVLITSPTKQTALSAAPDRSEPGLPVPNLPSNGQVMVVHNRYI